MAKLGVLLAAFVTVQAVIGGVPHWNQITNVEKIGKYTHDLTEALKTDYNVQNLSYLRDGLEKLIDVLDTKHIDDNTLLELKNKFHELLVNLQNPKVMSQRLVEDLNDVWRIFHSISRQLTTGEQRIEVHRILVEVVEEYCLILERTCSMLIKSNVSIQREVERVLTDTITNLQTVPLDNNFVKKTVVNLIYNYIRDLEMVREILKDEIDCLKTVVERDIDVMTLQSCLEKLLTVVKEKHLEDLVYARLLQATRTLEFNIYTMCHVKVALGETSEGFEVQIQTVANGLINAINTISIENEQTHHILQDLVREFVSEIQGISNKLKMRHVNTRIDIAIEELKHVRTMDVDAVKMQLVNAVQKATMEMTTILRRKLTDDVYGIVSDFLAVLQRQTMQIQNIYQSITEKLPLEKLAMQVQTITNGVMLYLRNVPTNDIMIREKLEVQVHHLVNRVKVALNRIHPVQDEEFTKTINNIKNIVTDFENFMEKIHITSIQEVVFHFDILAQKLASGIKQLTWVVKSKDTLSDVVRSFLGEYLIIIENIQVKIQRINQVAQVGESPKELALQIQVISEHLRKLLMVFISNNNLTKNMLMWQVRCLSQVLEVIIEQLQAKTVTETGGIYHEVALSLKNTHQLLENSMENSKTINVYQFRVIIGNVIRKAAMELHKLTVHSHSDIQEGHGVQTTFVRSLLMQFLLTLQDFHIQVQHNFQIVLSGQSPMIILREIGGLTNKILGLLQETDVNVDVLAMQLGEYTQTIENVLNLLHHRMKNNGEHETEQEKISDVLGKMSLILQNVNVKDVRDVREKLEMTMRKFMTVMQELVTMNMQKVKLMQVGTHTGILHGALSNMLVTMRNMYLQLQHVIKRMPENKNTYELLNQITMVGNNIMPALETIIGSTTPVKQALDLQVFKYARELNRLVKKLDSLSNPKIKINIQEALMVLEQTGSSLATLTINEIKLHLNKLVQGINNEIQKVDNRDVLVDYLRTLKNLHLQIQTISRMSHQSENYQLIGMLIDSAVIELCKSLQNLPSRNRLMAKSIVLESHELAQLIANVINRYQAASVLQKNALFMEISSELKTIQLHLQEVTVRRMYEDFDTSIVEVVANVERAAILIEELMWTPVTQTNVSQYRPDMPTFIRVTLHDFLTAVQNMVIQIDSVLVHMTDDKLMLVEKLSQDKMGVHLDTGKEVLYHPEMELYKGMTETGVRRTEVSDLLMTMMRDSYDNLKNEMLSKDTIKNYVKHLLVLVEEIMELEPTDLDSKMFVQQMHSVDTAFKRMLANNVFVIVSTCEEFYHKLTHATDKHLLVLVKNWIGEFCSVLKHSSKVDSTTGDLKNIEMVTEKIVENLRGKDQYQVVIYARNYMRVLHRILNQVPDSLGGDLKNLQMRDGETKMGFISVLQMLPKKLEKITMSADQEDATLVQNLLKSYINCLERLYEQLHAYHMYQLY